MHIDFGHFLDNKKTFFKRKIDRETDPFVFTPEVAYFINGGKTMLPPKNIQTKNEKESNTLL